MEKLTSLSSRRAWIEMRKLESAGIDKWVALLTESVDRNIFYDSFHVLQIAVALLTESVDRNKVCRFVQIICKESLSSRRAWIEIYAQCAISSTSLSLSSRRAWIEIPSKSCCTDCGRSLSSRRAWIEILIASITRSLSYVALLTESVDRNAAIIASDSFKYCRSPHGEHG